MTEKQRARQREYNRRWKAKQPKSFRSFVRFTKEEIEYIVLHSRTERKIDIARYFGCHPSAITYQIRKNGK